MGADGIARDRVGVHVPPERSSLAQRALLLLPAASRGNRRVKDCDISSVTDLGIYQIDDLNTPRVRFDGGRKKKTDTRN